MNKTLKAKKIIFTVCSLMFLLFVSFGALSVNAFDPNFLATDVQIEIDLENYDVEEMPNALVGETYPVFDYSATDNLGNVVEDKKVLVYYDVNNDTNRGGYTDDVLIPIIGERFKTESIGTYVIEYTAVKGHLSARERVYITAIDVDTYGELNYIVNNNIPDEVMVGQSIFLHEGTVVFDSRFGNAKVNVDVTYDGQYDIGEIRILGNDNITKYFVPYVAGEYTVTYSITNILGEHKQVQVAKKITVENSDLPIISQPVFSKLIHKNEQVIFPCVEAVEYRNGNVYFVPVEVFVGGQSISSTMSYKADQTGEFVVEYKAKSIFDEQKVAVYTQTINVIDVEDEAFIDKTVAEKYLYVNGFASEFVESENVSIENAVVLTADGSEEGAYAQFKNPLAAINVNGKYQYLSVKVGVEPTKSNFEELYFTFTDSKFSSEKIEISFAEKVGFNTKFVEVYINGKLVKTLTDKLFTVQDKVVARSFVTVGYDDKTFSILDEDGKAYGEIFSYINGAEFKGFTSGKAFVEFGVRGISGESQIKLTQIATQTISSSTEDDKRPVFLEEPFSGRAEFGQAIIIPMPKIFDSYDQNPFCKIKITDANGTFTKKITQDYEYMPVSYGKVSVEYIIEDASGNSSTKKKSIYVVDRVAPIVNAIDIAGEVSVGEKYSFPNFTAIDNSNKACTVSVTVTDPYGSMHWVKPIDGKYEYVFKISGNYVVTFSAMDTDGNTTKVNYNVVCR